MLTLWPQKLNDALNTQLSIPLSLQLFLKPLLLCVLSLRHLAVAFQMKFRSHSLHLVWGLVYFRLLLLPVFHHWAYSALVPRS